jgi:hypothetical protein
MSNPSSLKMSTSLKISTSLKMSTLKMSLSLNISNPLLKSLKMYNPLPRRVV